VETLAFPEAEVPLDLRRQQVALQDLAWPPETPGAGSSGAGPWHDPALSPWSLLLVEDGRVLAALDVLSKEVVHAGEVFAASGLSAVVTDPDLRGRGYASTLCAEARRWIGDRGTDLGLFTCDRPLLGLYVRAGWEHLEGSVLVGGTQGDPFPSDLFDKVTLGAFFTPRAIAAAPGFRGARVELYPGTVDRLW
jgi:GNAT superfamily N-acetyltransferase